MHSSRMRTGRSLTVCCSLFRGGVCSQGGCLLRGVFARGVSAPGGVCLLPGVSARGVSALGVWSGGVCSWGGGVSQHALRQTPSPHGQNSWHTLVKILPWPNFVAAGNYQTPKDYNIQVWKFVKSDKNRKSGMGFLILSKWWTASKGRSRV